MIENYLIDLVGHDWSKLLEPWQGLLPGEFDLWMVNRIGDAILVYNEGTVHLLDIGVGAVAKLADSREDLVEIIEQEGNAELWLAIPLIDDLVAAGVKMEPWEIYSFKTPPLLGGQYEVSNIKPVSIPDHYKFLGQVYLQTKDLPEGTTIRIDTNDIPS